MNADEMPDEQVLFFIFWQISETTLAASCCVHNSDVAKGLLKQNPQNAEKSQDHASETPWLEIHSKALGDDHWSPL